MPLDPNPIKDILYRTTARFLTLRPNAVMVDDRPRERVEARILAHGSARSLYRGRRPCCRSLDGLESIEHKSCEACVDLKNCTPQVRLHLLIEQRPYQLLLAYTSAKNFLLYVQALAAQGLDVHNVVTAITITDRGSWGEARFQRA